MLPSCSRTRRLFGRWRVRFLFTRKNLHEQKKTPKVSLFAHESLRRAMSVVIPCHNEEMNVGPLVKRILELYGEYIYEIIPVNDGSTDARREVLVATRARGRSRETIAPSASRMASGLAIAEGLAAATGSYVLTMDCDFQHLLPEFRDLFDGAAAGYDVVIGSRFSRHSVLLELSFLKIFANRAFHALAVVLFGRRIRDVTNNLKIMRREVVADLLLRQPGFAVNAETGLQPLLTWVTKSSRCRSPGSTALREWERLPFVWLRVGGGYWSVLAGLWLKHAFGIGPYRGLARRHAAREIPSPRCCIQHRSPTMSSRQERWLLLALSASWPLCKSRSPNVNVSGQTRFSRSRSPPDIAWSTRRTHAHRSSGDFVEPIIRCRQRSFAVISSMISCRPAPDACYPSRHYFRTQVRLFIISCSTVGP